MVRLEEWCRRLSRVVPKEGFGKVSAAKFRLVPPLHTTHTVHHLSGVPPGRPETTDLGSWLAGRKVRFGQYRRRP